MPINSVQLVLTVLLIAFQLGVGTLMLVRKQSSTYPLFFTFIVFGAIATASSAGSYAFARSQYPYVYWVCSTIYMLIGFGVLYEVFVSILKPYSAVIDLGKMLFSWAALFLLLAGFLTAMATGGSRPTRFIACAELLDRCVHLMQIGMLMLLLFFEKRLNFSWRSRAMAMGLGMGILAAMDLGMSYAEMRLPQFTSQMSEAYSAGLICILAFWGSALLSKQPARSTAADSPTRLILQRWNEALTGYGYGDVSYASHASSSFLPNVERTVDRVLARKIVQ